MDAGRSFLFITLIGAFLAVMMPAASAATFQVKMVLNETAAGFYIPGVGELSYSSLGNQIYGMPPHFYLASYWGGNLAGIINNANIPISVSTGKATGIFSLGADQNLTGSRTLLVFTGGGWRNIDREISGVEDGRFFEEINPNFGYSGHDRQRIKICTRYDNIDISGDAVFQRGPGMLEINNAGVSQGKVLLQLRKR